MSRKKPSTEQSNRVKRRNARKIRLQISKQRQKTSRQRRASAAQRRSSQARRLTVDLMDPSASGPSTQIKSDQEQTNESNRCISFPVLEAVQSAPESSDNEAISTGQTTTSTSSSVWRFKHEPEIRVKTENDRLLTVQDENTEMLSCEPLSSSMSNESISSLLRSLSGMSVASGAPTSEQTQTNDGNRVEPQIEYDTTEEHDPGTQATDHAVVTRPAEEVKCATESAKKPLIQEPVQDESNERPPKDIFDTDICLTAVSLTPMTDQQRSLTISSADLYGDIVRRMDRIAETVSSKPLQIKQILQIHSRSSAAEIYISEHFNMISVCSSFDYVFLVA
ncbi:unnamed protein product [Anisakis simplex]|uniref:Uncharacterized protein n=1 Tax=Anisakis simplex TaxID=6269 RepID=A0A0M3K628_ANISI|nr:unnamed protein product [Anisakis simplex]